MPIIHHAVTRNNSFEDVFLDLRTVLTEVKPFDVGEWQSIHTSMPMHELRNVSLSMPIGDTAIGLATRVGARLPWAEDHFQERVGGEPLNPSPSEAWWPFAKKKSGETNPDHKSEGEAFSHTYPERIWPKMANGGVDTRSSVEGVWETNYHHGIRFEYGDLGDVVKQLADTPFTRQAFLPIWFPEDTGAVHGKRVPCTLGYHFAIRDGKLDITYYMRSTDLLRHFQDDIYMAGRLAQWVAEEINKIKGTETEDNKLRAGELIFHTANLHIFAQDLPMIEFWKTQGKSWI